MRKLTTLLFILIGFATMAQDTTDVYVINNTNRLAQIGDSYSFFYRDLKYVKEIRELKFDDQTDFVEFVEKAYKVLDKNIELIAKGYSLKRNAMSKNVLKIRNKDGGYVLIKRGTLDNMKEAIER